MLAMPTRWRVIVLGYGVDDRAWDITGLLVAYFLERCVVVASLVIPQLDSRFLAGALVSLNEVADLTTVS